MTSIIGLSLIEEDMIGLLSPAIIMVAHWKLDMIKQ